MYKPYKGPCRFTEKLIEKVFCSILEDLCLKEKCEPWMLCDDAIGDIFPGAEDTLCLINNKECQKMECKQLSDTRFI